jgi:transmembrane sensor
MKNSDAIEDEAAHWLVREERGLGLKERVSFEHWLAEETAHRVSYLRLKASWRKADQLSAIRESLPRTRPSLRRHLAILPKAAPLAALAACGLLLLTGSWNYFSAPRDLAVATAAGEHRSFALSDGTKIELNGNTSLQAKESGPGRVVTLDHGLAYFEVVHDEHHPFTVYAGNRKITDLGTKFSVYRKDDKVEVVVKEGRVRIDIVNSPVATPVFADRDNMVIAKADETLLAPKQSANATDNLTWRSGLLIFNDERLADVAKEFNKYNKKQILVAANAGDIKIGGSFRQDNIEGFKSLLEQGFDVRVKEDRGKIYVTK